MKTWEVKELYTLSETQAAPLLESVTYPWEALPKIHDFILELGETLSGEKISGSPAPPRWRPPLPLQDPVSSERMPRYVTAPLSVATPWWEREPW